MSYIGTSKVGGMYLGDTKIGKAYLGDDLVYSAGPPQPKVKVTTFTRTITPSSGGMTPSAYWYDFIIGAEYKFEFSYDVDPEAVYTRININNNSTYGFQSYSPSGSYTFTYNTQMAYERVNILVWKPTVRAVITVTITETIYPS